MKEHLLANKFGSNGIEHETWWPKQICLVRDGAHSCIQRGIYGNLEDRLPSIIVSVAPYTPAFTKIMETISITLLQSPRKVQPQTDNKAPTAPRFCANHYIRINQSRVIRGASKPNKDTPPLGLRYDGLYAVAEEEVRKTVNDVALAQFKLVGGGQISRVLTCLSQTLSTRHYSKALSWNTGHAKDNISTTRPYSH